eukprot:SAG31_NODE_6830_length_1875_cov_1.881194_2_plen_61_part_01
MQDKQNISSINVQTLHAAADNAASRGLEVYINDNPFIRHGKRIEQPVLAPSTDVGNQQKW